MRATEPVPPEFYVVLAGAEDTSRDPHDREVLLRGLEAMMPAAAHPRLGLPPVPVPPGMAGAAAAIGAMVCEAIYNANPLERTRAVKLLAALCAEAGAIARGRAA
jgi:hypothetical protein